MNFYELYNEISFSNGRPENTPKPPVGHLKSMIKHTYGPLPKFSQDKLEMRFSQMKAAAQAIIDMDPNASVEEIKNKIEELQVDGYGYLRLKVLEKT